jgi:outer membrane protein assembly factor BamB
VGLPRLTHAETGCRAHNDGVGDVLIDLGEQHGTLPSDTVASRGRPHRFRATLAALSTLLLVVLGGAAARAAPVGPVIVPARLGDNMFVEQDRLYVVSAGPETNDPAIQHKIVSTYALPAGELLSRTTVAVTGAIFQVTSVGSTVLVSYQVDTVGAEATVALTAGTDRALWRAPARLLSVSVPDNLVLLRENSPQFGDLHWFGLDLVTGRTRWSFEQPPQGYTTPAALTDGFPHRLITATTDGHIEVRDTATGTLVTEGDAGAPSGWSRRGITVWPTGDLVLIGGLGGITAYTLAGLLPRWHSTVELSGRWVQDCLDAICVFGYRGGVQALDPGTGRLRWTEKRWTTAAEAGSYLLVSGNEGLEGSYPLAVVEPHTGAVHGDFGAWRAAGPPRADGTVVGLRQRIGDDIVFYALLDPARLTVRVLGTATTVSGDCQATTDVLVCRRIDAAVAIWPLTE